MDTQPSGPGSLASLVRAALGSALSGEGNAPLREAAGLLVEALAKDPQLAAALDAQSFEQLLAVLDFEADSANTTEALSTIRKFLGASD